MAWSELMRHRVIAGQKEFLSREEIPGIAIRTPVVIGEYDGESILLEGSLQDSSCRRSIRREESPACEDDPRFFSLRFQGIQPILHQRGDMILYFLPHRVMSGDIAQKFFQQIAEKEDFHFIGVDGARVEEPCHDLIHDDERTIQADGRNDDIFSFFNGCQYDAVHPS